MRLLAWLLLSSLLSGPAYSLAIDWVLIGSPGNAVDSGPGLDFGAVNYLYSISRNEITNAQYAEFLNAVARKPNPSSPGGSADVHGLWDARMASGTGGIVRSEEPDGFSYGAIPGRENKPVVFVEYTDAVRFANWLQNGQSQPGFPRSQDTEVGSYQFSSARATRNAPAREGVVVNLQDPSTFETFSIPCEACVFRRTLSSLQIALPSESEWYKAAYYDAVHSSYLDFPTGRDLAPACTAPAQDNGDAANCGGAVGDLTDVGAYPLSASPFGTLDQAGNAAEWVNSTEEVTFRDVFDETPDRNIVSVEVVRVQRALLGGAWNGAAADSGGRPRTLADAYPAATGPGVGFRVVLLGVPEPATGGLVSLGLVGLALLRRRALPDLRAR